MKTSIVAGSLLAALSLVGSLSGQQVAADVVVRGGPVAGRVVIADGYSAYRRPAVNSRRVPARVIIVEQVHVRRHRDEHQWRRHGFRPVMLYVANGRYYDRRVSGWPAMRSVLVFERNGRFYQECEERHGHDRRDHDRDRHGRESHQHEWRDHDWHDHDWED